MGEKWDGNGIEVERTCEGSRREMGEKWEGHVSEVG